MNTTSRSDDLEQAQGGRLLNALIDSRAKQDANRRFVLVPKSDIIQEGFKELRYGVFASAVSNLAFWLDRTLGLLARNPSARQTIAYIGPNDLRYVILLLAAERTNRQLLIPLMYNSPEAQIRLIDSTNTRTVLSTESHKHHWDKVLSARKHLDSCIIPDLKDLSQETGEYYPYSKRFDEVKNETLYIIQTSGTTGFPKPLHQTHSAVARFDEDVYKAATLPFEQRPLSSYGYEPHTMINTMPFSWIGGLIVGMIMPLFTNTTIIILPPSVPVPITAEAIEAVLQHYPSVDVAVYIPDTIRRLLTTEAGTDHLKGLHQLIFTGAPLEREIGDMLAQHTRVTGLIGSTEIGGAYPCLMQPDPKDWAWLRLDLNGNGWSLQHFSEDLYELVVQREPERLHPGFILYPDLDLLRTGDLFKEHPDPTKKGYYRIAGRADDFIKLSTMTKFNAIHIEMVLNQDEEVERSVVGGADRLTPFVILQPAQEWSSKQEAVEKMWRGVEKANEGIFHEARLRKEMVIVTDAERKIGVTQKGTSERRKTIEMYAKEIEEAYANYQ
ncbi:AMP-binding enzyme-like protein 18 [Elsinoe fawcettii]|nr:AMP-binding enzyme-like protein 18 [Elsinoe fawcettii]